MKKRIVAWLCSLAMVLSALWIAPVQTAEAADGTITITQTETRFVKDGGHTNFNFSGMPSDYKSGNGNIVTQEFIDAGWMTFDGGLTAEEYLNGHLTTYLATSGIIQFNWRDRGAAFVAGASFTLKAGAPLTYVKTDGSIGTVTLDANYTFTFEETDNADTSYNIVRMSKVVDKGTISITSTGVDLTIDTTHNYNFMNITFADALTDFGSAISGGFVNAEYVDAGYITLDGMTKDDLFGSMRQGRIEIENIIQFAYDMRESGFPMGATFTWHKGAPLYYTNTSGDKCCVRLDADYLFTVGQPINETCHNSISVTKVVVPEYKGEMSIKGSSVGFVIETTYNYINISVDSMSDWAGRSDEGYINAEYIDAGHITFDGGLTKEVFLEGLKAGRLEANGIIQLNYALRDSGFPVGSSFTWHEGAPIYYKNTAGGISYVTLDATYKFTSVDTTESNQHNRFAIEKVIIPQHKGDVSITSEGVSFSIDTTYNYNYINITIDALSDYASRLEAGHIDAAYVEAGHIVFADGLTAEIFFQGMRSGRLETNNVVQLCYDMREAGFPDGSSLTFKKGAPFYYNNTEGGISYVTLDADYKFVFTSVEDGEKHNTATVTLLACSVEGHTPEAVSGKDATCQEPGLTEGSKCSVCGEILEAQQETEPVAHNIVYKEAITPACHYNGQIEHWYCSDCGTFWADEARTQITNALSVVLPATKDSELVHVEAKDATCMEEGNIEYWYCKDCEQFWQDEALTQLTNVMNVKLGIVDHKAVKIPAKAAEVGKTGLTEGSQCSVCGTIFKAQEKTPALTLAAPKASKVTKATGGKKQITVKFKKVSGVTRYEIQMATKKNMKKGLKTYKVTKSKDMKNGKYVVKKLKAKTTYYVRIRTVKTVNGVTKTSQWSKVVKASKTK